MTQTAQLAWFQYPSDSAGGSYGQIQDPLATAWNPYKKPDVNWAVPFGVPITSLTSGMVTDVTDHGKCCGGLSVVVLMDRPLNRLATHVAYNFLGNATVRVGQRVGMGSQVGTAGSPYGIDFALGLTPDNTWGGASFNLNATGNSLLDPHLLLSGARSLGSGGGIGTALQNVGLAALAPTFISVSDSTHAILNNVPGFQGLTEALDNAETFVPFQIKSTGGQDVGILGHLPFIGQDITNAANLATLPSDAIQALLTFITANTLAFLIRAIIVYIGIAIVMTLIRNALLAGAEAAGPRVQQVARIAGTVGTLTA